MAKYVFDNSNGLWYELIGDYYIPCLTLPVEEKNYRHLGAAAFTLSERASQGYIHQFTHKRQN